MRSLRLASVVESQQFDPALIKRLFERADVLGGKDKKWKVLEGKRVAMAFYEPSTRTRWSFEAATNDLGGTCISTESAQHFSSAAKGERLEHTVRMAAGYADAIVLRHFEDDAAIRARDFLESLGLSVPIINAGCGKGQHPTQALLDLYTIGKKIGRFENFSIAIVGDLKHGRTARSLAYLLGKFSGVHMYFVAPPQLAIGQDILAYLNRRKAPYQELAELEKIMGEVDFIYMTRVQKERFEKPEEYEELKTLYRLTAPLVQRMKSGAHLLHPLPIVDEIAPEVDRMRQTAYFEQADNGLPVRKALLAMILAPNNR